MLDSLTIVILESFLKVTFKILNGKTYFWLRILLADVKILKHCILMVFISIELSDFIINMIEIYIHHGFEKKTILCAYVCIIQFHISLSCRRHWIGDCDKTSVTTIFYSNI